MSNDVNALSDQVRAMQPGWKLMDDLMGGTGSLRAAGRAYLPQRPLEADEDYQARLDSATLFPALSETLRRLVGRVFSEPITIGDDVPDWINAEVLPDVDLQGRNLHVFAKEWFEQALRYGLSHCLIDSPLAHGVRTLAEQRKAGLRPYLIRIEPSRVLGWREKNGNLEQVRIRFERTEPEGEFGTKTIEQVRVYEPWYVRVYERSRDGWHLVEAIETGFERIPLVTLYTNRTGLLMADPPLRELAWLNAKHWRMQSGNESLIDTASVPILSLTGVDEGDAVIIGAKHSVRLPAGADIKYVEHSGAAIEAGRRALLDLVDEMRQAGAKLLRPAEGARTATEAREDAASDNSHLGGMASALQDTLNDVLDLVAEYRGADSGGHVRVNPNLDPDVDSTQAINDVLALYRDGIISRATVFEAAKRLGRVPDTLEWEDEQARIGDMAGL